MALGANCYPASLLSGTYLQTMLGAFEVPEARCMGHTLSLCTGLGPVEGGARNTFVRAGLDFVSIQHKL